MYKRMKRLCSILCSSMCLLGGANANSLDKNSKAGSVTSLESQKSLGAKKECVSLEVQNFLDNEKKRLETKIGNQSSFRWEMLDSGRLNKKSKEFFGHKGALAAITNNEKILGYSKDMDSNSLRKLSKLGKDISNGFYIASYFPLIFGIVVSVIETFRPELNETEISRLLQSNDENLAKVLNHFGFSLSLFNSVLNGANSMGSGTIKTVKINLISGDTDKKRASNVCRILLLAQVKSLFRMLPPDVKEAFDNLNNDGVIRNVIKFHWIKLVSVGIFSYLFSTFFGGSLNVMSQCVHGFSEEVDILADKIDELQKSVVKAQKSDKSSSPKPNVNKKRIDIKKNNLNASSVKK